MGSGRIFHRKICIYNYVALCECGCAPVETRRQPPNAHDGQRSSTGPTDIAKGRMITPWTEKDEDQEEEVEDPPSNHKGSF